MKVIELTKGQVAIVDDEDFERIAQWRWHVSKKGYVTRSVAFYDGDKRRNRTIYMALEILPAKPGHTVDHRNGNKLDNRRLNLRHATSGQQAYNRKIRRESSTGFKGVSKNGHGFIARIKAGKARKNLGTFPTALAAYAAYQTAAIELHGEFARLN